MNEADILLSRLAIDQIAQLTPTIGRALLDVPEMRGDYPPEQGAYTPIWMPIADLLIEPVRPRVLAEFVIHALLHGWPHQPCLLEG